MTSVIQNFDKDPDALLDYVFDWSDWLEAGEVISSYEIDVETGLTKESDSESDGLVTVWLSGGANGESYIVGCEITTSKSRTDERSMRLVINDR